MIKMKLIWSILFAFCVAYPLSVVAVDNWPTSACITNGTFDKAKCSQKTGWIAVGTLKEIHLLSYPQDKPLSEFTLQVTKWEKADGRLKNKKELKYLEGYFAQSPQAGSLVRVYGYQKVKHLPEKEYGVFYIEQIDEKE